jgi:hypothetical protein
VAASKQFYEAVAPHAGFRLNHESPNRAQFVGAKGSFSVVDGTPTEHVHIAFPVDRNSTVDEFHRALTEAGYRDNGTAFLESARSITRGTTARSCSTLSATTSSSSTTTVRDQAKSPGGGRALRSMGVMD